MSKSRLVISAATMVVCALASLSARGYQGINPSSIAAKPLQERMTLPSDGFADGAVPADTPGLVKPTEKKFVEPKYTRDALRAKIQGTVVVEAIVGIDGTVTKARVFESLDKDFGLDAAAVDAVMRWTFEPGTLSGRAVPVYARLDLMFRCSPCTER